MRLARALLASTQTLHEAAQFDFLRTCFSFSGQIAASMFGCPINAGYWNSAA
jgi:hypothetical protein